MGDAQGSMRVGFRQEPDCGQDDGSKGRRGVSPTGDVEPLIRVGSEVGADCRLEGSVGEWRGAWQVGDATGRVQRRADGMASGVLGWWGMDVPQEGPLHGAKGWFVGLRGFKPRAFGETGGIGCVRLTRGA